MNSLKQVNFYQLVQATMKIERFETSSKERSQKKKFSRGASSFSGKRVRESPAQSEYSSAIRGRRQGSNVAPSSGRGASVRQGETLECPHCHKRHLGVCRLLTGGKSVTLHSTRDRGRGGVGPIQYRGQGSTISETMDCPITKH